jgi:hypothetical protein
VLFFDPNGSKYVGGWKDGEYNGQGTYTWESGNKYEGEWEDGSWMNGTHYDENGNITHKIVNGEWIKQ